MPAAPYKPSLLAQLMAFVVLVSSLSGILLAVLYLFRGSQACDAAWQTFVRLVDEALDD